MKTLKNIKNSGADEKRVMMRIGISTDFSWFELKKKLIEAINTIGYELVDIEDYELVPDENYPDFIVPFIKLNSGNDRSQNQVEWKNHVEVCKAVNQIPGVCAALITNSVSPGREKEEDLYVRCLGSQIKGYSLSREKVMTFLNADGSATIPFNECLAKVRVLEKKGSIN